MIELAQELQLGMREEQEMHDSKSGEVVKPIKHEVHWAELLHALQLEIEELQERQKLLSR